MEYDLLPKVIYKTSGEFKTGGRWMMFADGEGQITFISVKDIINIYPSMNPEPFQECYVKYKKGLKIKWHDEKDFKKSVYLKNVKHIEGKVPFDFIEQNTRAKPKTENIGTDRKHSTGSLLGAQIQLLKNMNLKLIEINDSVNIMKTCIKGIYDMFKRFIEEYKKKNRELEIEDEIEDYIEDDEDDYEELDIPEVDWNRI